MICKPDAGKCRVSLSTPPHSSPFCLGNDFHLLSIYYVLGTLHFILHVRSVGTCILQR